MGPEVKSHGGRDVTGDQGGNREFLTFIFLPAFFFSLESNLPSTCFYPKCPRSNQHRVRACGYRLNRFIGSSVRSFYRPHNGCTFFFGHQPLNKGINNITSLHHQQKPGNKSKNPYEIENEKSMSGKPPSTPSPLPEIPGKEKKKHLQLLHIRLNIPIRNRR